MQTEAQQGVTSSRSPGKWVAEQSPTWGSSHVADSTTRGGLRGPGAWGPLGAWTGDAPSPGGWRAGGPTSSQLPAVCRAALRSRAPGRGVTLLRPAQLPTVPSGMLWTLSCQLFRHDVCLVPGGTGPHVPHMPPEWDANTEQLSWPPLLPSADSLPLCSLSSSAHLPLLTRKEVKGDVGAFAGPPYFPKPVHMHWFQFSKHTYSNIKQKSNRYVSFASTCWDRHRLSILFSAPSPHRPSISPFPLPPSLP